MSNYPSSPNPTTTPTTSTTSWYFAYGSNLNVDRLYEKRLKPRGCWMGRRLAARLDNWELAFNIPSPAWAGAGVGNMAQRDSATVWGTVNEMDDSGLETLDIYEQVKEGMYKRISVSVFCPALDATVEAVAYVGVCKLDDSLVPSRDYLFHFLAGRDVLPAEYVKKLEALKVLDVTADPHALQK